MPLGHSDARAAARAADLLAGHLGLRRVLPPACLAGEFQEWGRLGVGTHGLPGRRDRQRSPASTAWEFLPDLGPFAVVEVSAAAAGERNPHATSGLQTVESVEPTDG